MNGANRVQNGLRESLDSTYAALNFNTRVADDGQNQEGWRQKNGVEGEGGVRM